MTHPETLTIPRAVVEQALDVLALYASTYNLYWIRGMPILEPSADAVLEQLRAALQPQAADDKIKALAAKAPKDVRIYPGGGEVIPQAASDCRTCQHLSEAWGVCEARPKCVGGEQYVYFPEKQLWDKTPRNDGQAAHQEMREALYAEFNRAVGRQHD